MPQQPRRQSARRAAQAPAKLKDVLVLHRYLLSFFNATDLRPLREHLAHENLEGRDEDNVSKFCRTLQNGLFNRDVLTREQLFEYDENIFRHTGRISAESAGRRERVEWKYFQYMALLFTEIYLDRYFSDKKRLLAELNDFLEKLLLENFAVFADFPKYVEEDLNKIAFWNATGSGKTLLMHVNILQYEHYAQKHHAWSGVNNVLVITPNEGLSEQHLRELKESGLQAEAFRMGSGSLFDGQQSRQKIIKTLEISKLAETTGDKTVAVESFEGNNLVLADEGHRGSSGDAWKSRRDALSATGFAIEYSATFGQAVQAQSNAASRKELLYEYGKATLFDYSYRYFYEDGYGKDFQILNANETWDENFIQRYLTAWLLTFYEQTLLFREEREAINVLDIAKPLAIFVGGKVTALRKVQGQETSDVLDILRFFDRFLHNRAEAVSNIEELLGNTSAMVDNRNHSIFRNSFAYLRERTERTAQEIYDDIRQLVFHSTAPDARLHIENLKGQTGELGLRVGAAEYFGVINVSDDKELLKLCEKQGFITEEREFSTSLFQNINRLDSQITMLIGSKKFSEGWSSWRVSAMGLMNVGRGEGSEIIQLFGRGVRLKGYQMSLKRSGKLERKPLATLSKHIRLLETLNIFGVRADYMAQFREYLKEEDVPTGEDDMKEITIPIKKTFEHFAPKGLQYIRVQKGTNFKKSGKVVALRPLVELAEAARPMVKNTVLDWYSKVQVMVSAKQPKGAETKDDRETARLESKHWALFDWNEVYFVLQRFKNEKAWHNLSIQREDLPRILADASWYTLYVPSKDMEVDSLKKVRIWQDIAIALLKKYCERLYTYEKRAFESQYVEAALLTDDHDNFETKYTARVPIGDRLVAELENLVMIIEDSTMPENVHLDGGNAIALRPDRHLYYPLFWLKKGSEHLDITPTALNKSEGQFVDDLQAYYKENTEKFADKEVYLLRNKSRAGIGFFESYMFYPDFILWILRGGKQYITFIDPKGLRQEQGLDSPKITLHKTIRETIQPKLNNPRIELNSFIITATRFDEIRHWKGLESVQYANEHHILFMNDANEQGNYIEALFSRLLSK